MHKKNIFEEEWREMSEGEKFQRGAIACTGVGGDNLLGCTAYCVKPGKRAFPKHAHLANDEALYIVSGRGELTIGDDASDVKAGDFILLPRGEEFAHILVNNSDDDVVYLCISTMIMPEVVHYPNSEKLGVLGSKDFWSSGKPGVSGFYKPNPVGYWDGEEVD